ncbi:23S rRNA (uracil(747)-C(5))-methyltransferase RlmC [Thiosulfatimonas sediminis]|uniref:23S rRNA (uracil(747)-C(5))-methyltransferase RlmC n=1 Tax=Thiosulfatimonas sediminis TaxID=2675054 RepID=A0A6F8PWZ7_9GAMM|nr:23S rRNA (uracil(747)-C(5))-methyltransferase RlmC [Thiosulfatimonas sediminis]BBP46518.1 23S rRNA (uracil(747)-C(5))-methyltransferase RlmC [Thiosulfatimonas sediminis]
MNGCEYFNQGLCRSCTNLPVPYAQQLIEKQQACAAQLPMVGSQQWLPIMPSAPFGFRNKAKMVVGGTWQNPQLGIVDYAGVAQDLSACPLYPQAMAQAFTPIKDWITACCLAPYQIVARSGELKYVLLTYSEREQGLMVRFVVRSKEAIARMRQGLAQLLSACPAIQVVSVNIQPVPMAIVEGPEEIILTAQQSLTMWLNDLPLHLKPQSFFQTNDAVAAELYRQAQAWLMQTQPEKLWDLFCGVGGFALHAAQCVSKPIIGIEISSQAIASAQQSAAELGLESVTFRALSADEFACAEKAAVEMPDTVIVNPPRRGIGAELCAFLENSPSVQTLIYSSCNPQTLAKDLAMLTSFRVQQARVFDMFAHTHHAEVMVLLSR